MRIPPLLLLSAALLPPAGCITVEEPPCPPVEMPEGGAEASHWCQCDPATFVGRAYRLVNMHIDEPESMAGVLNPMWSKDLLNNVLNVLFKVTGYKKLKDSTYAFDGISLAVGPGWRNPKTPLTLTPAKDKPSASVVESYCHLAGMTASMEVKPDEKHQCTFRSTGESALHFHTGPTDHPMVCSPEIQPPNTIPIQNLKVNMGFNEDCTGIDDGYLEGCITAEDAQKICMCLKGTGNCPMAPVDPTKIPKGTDPSTAYCMKKCGGDWFAFPSAVGLFGLKMTCMTLDGRQGYRLQGTIDAVEITDIFNPVQSGDCTEE